ncbi:unnamed protein product [Ranitomeya imitator]|uniref:Uncharacterized protein n=1 Tax=Ranitomeya imitator TaxID=111125 RepID=A0ABN9LW21_9NEOB|nr:unnamed protein product [Ranitomeya imitator]
MVSSLFSVSGAVVRLVFVVTFLQRSLPGEFQVQRFLLFYFMDVAPPPAPLLFRKLSNPDLFSSGKVKLHRQLSQDDCRLRRGSLTASVTGKQLLPLSGSAHSGVSQLTWQPPESPPTCSG